MSKPDLRPRDEKMSLSSSKISRREEAALAGSGAGAARYHVRFDANAQQPAGSARAWLRRYGQRSFGITMR
jgi:hypothetical protein